MPIQPLQLDDRSFEQLYAEAISRVPVHTPEWTNFNESDPGVTIVQLFAFMTENILYRSNRIPEANRLKFLSLLNIGLQPATPAQGLITFTNDRGPVQAIPLDVGQQVLAGKVAYTTRTPVNVLPVTAVGFYKKPQPALDDATKQQYRQFYQTFLESDIDQLLLYQSKQLAAPAVGKPLPVVDLIQDTIDSSLWLALVGPPNVPIDTVRQAIAGQTITLGIYPSVQSSGPSLPPLTSPENTPQLDPGLNFYIAAPLPDPTTPGVGMGDPRYTRLKPDYAEDVLDNPGIVQLTLPAYPTLLLWDFGPEEDGTGDYPPLVENTDLKSRIVTWLRIRLPLPPPTTTTQAGSTTVQSHASVQQDSGGGANGSTNRQARLTWVGANAARILQAVPIVKEPLGVGTGGPDQMYRLANTPVIMPDVLQAHAMIGAASAGTFALEVQNDNGGWDTWQLIDDLYAAKPTDKYYTLDPEAGIVTFGSGINGFRPPLNKNIRISYEYGGRSAGQVAIGAINKSAVPLPGGMKVENPLPTWGASDGQSISDGERSITHYLRNRDRCVTASDFSDVTLHTPGVSLGRVEVLPLFNPLMFSAENATQTWPGTVTIMVIPQYDQAHPDTPEPDFLTLNTIGAWLDQRRLVTTEVYVHGPEYVTIWVTVGISALRGQVREVVQKRVMDALRAYLSPLFGGTPAGSGPTLEADCPQGSSDACGSQQGTGWPLSTDVRAGDLTGVAMRVPGVQVVNSLYLAWKLPDDTVITKTDSVPMAGLQLPRLEGIGVSIGDADDPADLFGQPTPGGPGTPPPNTTPVPTLPAKC